MRKFAPLCVILFVLLGCSKERMELEKARRFIERGEYTAALPLLEDKLSMQGRFLLMMAYLGLGDDIRVKGLLEDIWEEGQRDTAVIWAKWLGDSLRGVGAHRAFDYYALVCQWGEDTLLSPEALIFVGDVYAKRGDYPQAARLYLEVQDEEFLQIARKKALSVLLKGEMLDEAMHVAEEAMADRPDEETMYLYGEVAYKIAKRFYDQGSFRRALLYAEKVISVKKPPLLVDDAYFLCGEINFALKDYKTAEDCYKKVLSLDPYRQSPLTAKAKDRLKALRRVRKGR